MGIKPSIPQSISARSRRNLMTAMKDEAFTYVKLKLFAKAARRHGHTELAELFDRTADHEYLEHFAKVASLAGLTGTDEQNLSHAIQEESFEIEQLYMVFAREALEDGDLEVAGQFSQIRHDEAVHRLAFEEALAYLQTHDLIMGRA